MGAFDQGWQMGAQRSLLNAEVENQNRLAQRDALASVYQNSLQNPNLNQADRQALISQLMGLYQPHEAPSLIQRLSGLVKGQKAVSQPGAPSPMGQASTSAAPAPPVPASLTPSAPQERTDVALPAGVEPAANPVSAPPTPTPAEQLASVPADQHPFAPHPVLDTIHKGLSALENHLKGFAHPDAAPNPNAPDMGLLARTYMSPEQMKLLDYKALGENQLAVQGLRNQLQEMYLLYGKTPEMQALNGWARKNGYDSFISMPSELQLQADREVGNARRPQRLKTEVVLDSNSPTGYSASSWDQLTGAETSHFPGVLPPRGFVPTRRRSESTDQYGNVTSTISDVSPNFAGMPNGGAAASATPTPAGVAPVPVSKNAPQLPMGAAPANAAPTASPNATPSNPLAAVNASIAAGNATSKKLNKGKPVSERAPQIAQALPLDQDGHIPMGAGNAQVVEAANQLLDGQDVSKLPTKAREAASALARQYGWEQGMFTPKEKLLLRESSTFLNDAANSPSLDVLNNAASRLKLQQMIGDQSHKGLMGHLAVNAAAATMNPQESEFLRTYNQLVGTISGLAQLTRSGRATEATINRLVNELPNPYTTTSADDARARLQRLQKELDVAEEKGQFGAVQSSRPASKNAPQVPTTQTFTDNGVTYNIPSDKVDDFKKDHPNAR